MMIYHPGLVSNNGIWSHRFTHGENRSFLTENELAIQVDDFLLEAISL